MDLDRIEGLAGRYSHDSWHRSAGPWSKARQCCVCVDSGLAVREPLVRAAALRAAWARTSMRSGNAGNAALRLQDYN